MLKMNPCVLLAKKAVEAYAKERKIIEPTDDLPENFLVQKSGTFVTIEKNGATLSGRASPNKIGRELRGCIGTYLPTKENIAQEIIYNAIAAATEDYRFGPIQIKELAELSYTVYFLSEPELVGEFDPVKWASPKIRRILFNRVDPKKYGIIVKSGQKTGLLLPDLEGIDTVEKQIFIACQKGGINPEREKIIIYRFTVERHQ